MEALIFNEYFNEEEDATPVKKAKKQRISLHSYCMLPRGKNSMTDEWSEQRAHIPSTSALPAQLTPVAIASALQGSITAMNVVHSILGGSKTILHHHAKFHWKTVPKMTLHDHQFVSRYLPASVN